MVIQGSVAGVRTAVEPHALALESAADAMHTAGIGLAPTSGHVDALRRMANAMRADAALGRVPHAYGGMYAATEEQDANLQLADGGAEAPLPRAVLASLQAAGVTIRPGEVSLAELDTAMSGADLSARLLVKSELNRLGRLVA